MRGKDIFSTRKASVAEYGREGSLTGNLPGFNDINASAIHETLNRGQIQQVFIAGLWLLMQKD